MVASDDRRSATMAASSDRIIDSKMDKASIIKDAIDYIQELHEQERRIQADLIQLESGKLKKNAVFDLDQEIPTSSRLKKKGIDHSYDSRRSTTSSIEDLEISEEHCNYFKFVDDDDYDVISNVAPRTSIRSEEFNDPSTRVYEMDNEF
ncbi:unnamed protein product [Camellia sinensis]